MLLFSFEGCTAAWCGFRCLFRGDRCAFLIFVGDGSGGRERQDRGGGSAGGMAMPHLPECRCQCCTGESLLSLQTWPQSGCCLPCNQTSVGSWTLVAETASESGTMLRHCCADGVWACAVLELRLSMPPALPLLPDILPRHPPLQVIRRLQ